MVISGNDDSGTLKAAQATSTGVLRSSESPNLAIVDVIQDELIQATVPLDQTLADLGYGGNQLDDYGVNSATFTFYVPPGQTTSPDDFFELSYTHSALLNYERSGTVIILNGDPIGSVRFEEETAAQTINLARFTIPSNLVLPGNNTLEIRTTLFPLDICINPDSEGLWLMIWEESRLHMQLIPTFANPVAILDLDVYPAPFNLNSTLTTTAFVVQRNDPNSWRTAMLIASFLGDRANGAITTLSAFYADEIPEAERGKYHMLVVGQPTKLPILEELNEFLPAPFSGESDIASEENVQVIFRISPNTPIGYIQLITSPWNEDNIIITVLGNTPEGLAWAGSALGDSPLRSRLAGNFAAINDQQVVTADTRLSPLSPEIDATLTTGIEPVPPDVSVTAYEAERPSWIVPGIITSIALAVLILLGAIIANWRRRGRQPRRGRGTS
jgi:hypothetical protein